MSIKSPNKKKRHLYEDINSIIKKNNELFEKLNNIEKNINYIHDKIQYMEKIITDFGVKMDLFMNLDFNDKNKKK